MTQFGNYRIVKHTRTVKRNGTSVKLFEVRCKCGETKELPYGNIVRNRTGCLRCAMKATDKVRREWVGRWMKTRQEQKQ